ncbi:MAG: PQQ-like beta-propeller repeat protein [Planctomycetes bacterium]|nr:PQQ-like beta-propeller repeat protein [Planctomycetota bacterium]
MRDAARILARSILISSILFAGIRVAPAAAPGPDEDWPGFRGPTGLGYTAERSLPITWGGDGEENILWKSPLVGQGHASPIVTGGRVIVCTARWAPTVKEREKVIPEHHVLAYDAKDGKLFWDTQVPPGPWLRTDFRSGPGGGYACPTPASDGERIYCVFGSAVIAGLDLDGKIIWRKEIVPYTFDVTIGSSPVLFRGTVILFCAMAKPEDSKIIAFDARDGAIRWESRLPRTGFGHSTPIIIDVRGKPQMLCLASGMGEGSQALQSFDPADGRRLWWCWGGGDAASPAYGSGIVYFDSGRGGTGVAVDPTGEGDVTATHIKWKVEGLTEALGSPIIANDLVFRLEDPRNLSCWDLRDGRRLYKERLEGLSTTWASPIADPEGRVFYANAGKSYVIRAGRTFEVLAVNDLRDGNHASPAVAGGRMFLVGMKNVYAIGK